MEPKPEAIEAYDKLLTPKEAAWLKWYASNPKSQSAVPPPTIPCSINLTTEELEAITRKVNSVRRVSWYVDQERNAAAVKAAIDKLVPSKEQQREEEANAGRIVYEVRWIIGTDYQNPHSSPALLSSGLDLFITNLIAAGIKPSDITITSKHL